MPELVYPLTRMPLGESVYDPGKENRFAPVVFVDGHAEMVEGVDIPEDLYEPF